MLVLNRLRPRAAAALASASTHRHAALRPLCSAAPRDPRPPTPPGGPNVDRAEIAKFAALAADWWHPNGSAAPLHRLNPLRLSYIRSAVERHVLARRAPPRAAAAGADAARKPLSGVDIVDLGCGAGLVTEPLARLGACVLGADLSAASLSAAAQHARSDRALGDRLSYREASAEQLADEGLCFDAVLALEVVEHVPDVGSFLRAAARLVRPGGVLVVSTINRTPQSYALAIVAAEYVLRWLPRGTHRWDRLVTPDEVAAPITTPAVGLAVADRTGVWYNPVTRSFGLTDDLSVNYMLVATRPPRQGDAVGDAASGDGSAQRSA